MVRKIPMRKCVVTNERFPKQELIRIVRTPEDEIVLDLKGKLNGHGAYVSRSKETVAKARKNKALERALKMPIPEEIYQQLEQCVELE